MAKKKLNKAQRREQRLVKARQWVLNYEGKHMVRAYAERFKVDKVCAMNDLHTIGALSPEKLAIMKNAHELRIAQRKAELEQNKAREYYENNPDCSDEFFFIAGYTSGGAPYGVTWEEMGLEPYEPLDSDKKDEK